MEKPLEYQFGKFTLDLRRGCVLKADEEVKLRPKVYEALKYLVEHPGQLIGKQELMRAVWPDSFVTEDSLVQCALELRRALSDADQQLIKTVPRRGYLFAGTVTARVAKPNSSFVSDSFEGTEGRRENPLKPARKRCNLPIPRTSLIGRDQQVADAAALLLRDDIRLLSLTGPGGAGKTRLAIAVAAATAEHFSGGVQFAGLASISNSDLVATALADALEIQQVADHGIPQLIGEHLRGAGPFLLVVDNFEQVLPAATVVSETLDACPSLKMLVTSRSCLHVYGEHEFAVTPLAPQSALELFAQRASAVWPEFAMTSENATAVREICLRLDRLPLAIELAAARAKVLSPRAILDRLPSRFLLLTSGALDVPERQQTLRKTIDWSHGLLNEAERRLFRRMSVFVGGCTLEALEAVCNTGLDLGIDLFDGISSLVDQSLVQRVDRDGTEPRFAMLETIREYAAERLGESGEAAATHRAHAAYCLVLAEEGNPELSLPDRARWLAQCDGEVDNFRSALDWLLETRDLDWTLRLSMALFRFWDMREHLTEGRARLEAVLQLAGTERAKERARISHFLGALTTAQGDYPAAKQVLEQSLFLCEELQDEPGIAASLNALAVLARDRGDYRTARLYFERSLAYWRMLSDGLATARCLHNLADVVKGSGDYSRAEEALCEAANIFDELGDRTGSAWSVNQRGDIARAQGDTDGARAFYEQALSVFREAEDAWGAARSLTDLAYLDCTQGHSRAAHAACREALEIFVALEHRRGIARVLELYACLAATLGQPKRSLTLAAAAGRLRQLISAPLHQTEQVQLDSALEPAWKALGEQAGRQAWADGFAMTIETAIEYSRCEPGFATSA